MSIEQRQLVELQSHQPSHEVAQVAIANGTRSWDDFALCADPAIDPEIFSLYAPDDRMMTANQIRTKQVIANRICAVCVVRYECETEALNAEPYETGAMLYAGRTPKELQLTRKALAKARSRRNKYAAQTVA